MSSRLTYGVRMNRPTALIVLAAALACTASTATAEAAPPTYRAPVVRHFAPAPKPVRRPAAVPACTTAAPSTAAGYKAMFAKIDPAVWGAGDTALTVHLPGRAVWLYSDTASGPNPQHWTRFVHNTAINQTAGCLHVSNRGAQVLPNDGILYYWIDSAAPIDATHIRVTGYEMDSTTQATTGRFRDAQVVVSTGGDVTFQQWLRYRPAPAPTGLVKDGGYMGNSVSLNGTVICDNILTPPTAQYTYSPQLHRELPLASGKTLLSLAVGWVSGTPTWQDMRPVYREVTLP